MRNFSAITILAAVVLSSVAVAADDQGRGGRGGFGPIVLGPDDKPVAPPAPAGFDVHRSDIQHGTLALVEYESRTVGTRRKTYIYTPAGYTTDTKYPVLYLLHGIGGDEDEWRRGGNAHVILDNLIADKLAAPMVVVMPNGRAQPNDRVEGNGMASAPAFAKFEQDLLQDLIPFVESKYSVQDRSGAPRARRTFHGRWPVPQFWPGQSRDVRVDRRFFIGAEHEDAGRAGDRSREDAGTAAALDFLR